MRPSGAVPMFRRRRRAVRRLAAHGAAAFAIVLSVPSLAAAATLHVTDGDDGALPAATLRNQIAAAAPGDTVVIDGGVNPTLSIGEIAVDKDLTVRGQGVGLTTISADETSRIFNIGSVTPGATVAIERLTITAARSPSGVTGGPFQPGSAGASGGAIINAATLTVTNSTLSANATGPGGDGGEGFGGSGGSGGSGGAISNSGTLTITNSTFAGNTTGAGGSGDGGDGSGDGSDGGDGGGGGAISNSGALTITNSTLSGNTAGPGGAGGGASGSVGTFAGAGGEGGGGGAISNSGTLTATNTTHSGNAAGAGGSGGSGGANGIPGTSGSGGSGGAISSSGTLTVASSTLFANAVGAGGSRPFGPTSPAGVGGGVFSASGSASISNSIFMASGDGCAGAFTDGGHNINFPIVGGCPATFGTGDPKLELVLADNGGPTKTIALLSGSAAIDQIPSGLPSRRPAGLHTTGGRL